MGRMLLKSGIDQDAGLSSVQRTRVLIGDTRLSAEGLAKLLEPWFDIVGTVTNGHTLVDAAVKLNPEVILVEREIACLGAVSATVRIMRRNPSAKIIVVTPVPSLVDYRIAQNAGASGYITKMDSVQSLRQAVYAVKRGSRYVSPEIEALLRPGAPVSPPSAVGLTERQEEVLHLVTMGKTRKEIGEILNISPKTVEFHKSRIMELLGLHTTAELTRYIVERGSRTEPQARLRA